MSKSVARVCTDTPATTLEAPRLWDFSVDSKSPLISANVVSDSVRFVEFTLCALTGLIVAAAYVSDLNTAMHASYLIAAFATAGISVLSFHYLGLYRIDRLVAGVRNLPRIALGWMVAFAFLAAGLFFAKLGGEFSRFWMAAWFVAGGALLIAERLVVASLTQSWHRSGRLSRRAIIYGTGPVTEAAIAQLEDDLNSDIRICGLFDERGDGRAPTTTNGYPLLGRLQDLVQFTRSTRVDLIIVALPITAEARIDELLTELSQLPVDIKMPAGASRLRFAPHAYSRIGDVAMIDLMDKPIAAWGGIAKSVFDKVIAVAALIALAPVMAAVAIAIKLDSRGPVLFRQKRYGFNNELIEVFKFRSMYTDLCDATASKLVTKGDPRVTRVGRFIRKSSLDELPQLFNVLKGELSLVGPRPHALSAKAGTELYDDVVKGYFARHKVKPGITGWAQIHGWRGETDTELKIVKRVEHDIYYIENWSVFLDLYILTKTPFSLIKTENAY